MPRASKRAPCDVDAVAGALMLATLKQKRGNRRRLVYPFGRPLRWR
jgi:hypothetical protein